MNLFNKTIGAFIILLSFFLISASFLPSQQSIKAEIRIKSSQKAVFNQVNILKNRNHWSPFLKGNYKLKAQYNEIPAGTSAHVTYHYSNKNKLSLSIQASNSSSKITNEILINSNKKIKSDWTFSQQAQKTHISWKMELVELSFPFERVMGLVLKVKLQNNMNLGLENLKQYLESDK